MRSIRKIRKLDRNLSMLHLLMGNFEAGWSGREARLKVAGVYPKFPQPRWTGAESVDGKTILVCADEGLGDTIQFVRYVPMLTARGARLIQLVDEPTQPMHCPICSLPLAFGTRLDTIPSFASYLPVPAEDRVQAWEARLQEAATSRNRLRVGLVWSGNPAHKNDCNRSTSLQALSRILDVDATFVSLQKIRDRTTWLMLAYRPDFRWLLDGEDSPWYPTMWLFRQTKTRDYADVAGRVRTELLELIAGRQALGGRERFQVC